MFSLVNETPLYQGFKRLRSVELNVIKIYKIRN